MSEVTGGYAERAPVEGARGASRASSVAAIVAVILLSLGAGSLALAQPRAPRAAGVQLTLHGPMDVVRGRPTIYRGVVYRVRGLARLEALPHARLSARLDSLTGSSESVDLRADGEGRFEIRLVTPASLGSTARLVVDVEDGADTRSFEVEAIAVRSPYALLARTDRRTYAPGEPVHAFVLVRDAASLRPLVGESVVITGISRAFGGATREIVTGEDGVASASFTLPSELGSGPLELRASVGGEEVRLAAEVGDRRQAPFFVTLSVEPDVAPPGAPVTGVVAVRTAAGEPLRDARVALRVGPDMGVEGQTDASGVARIPFAARGYRGSEVRVVRVEATVTHPAFGEASAGTSYRVASPLALDVVATARLGLGLVPEVDDAFFVLVTDPRGEPPPAGLELEIEGAAVRGGRAVVHTDAAGIAEVPTRLPPGTWAPVSDGDERAPRETHVSVRIAGPIERTAWLAVSVAHAASVRVTVGAPLAAPGTRVSFAIARRPIARQRVVVVELRHGETILDVRTLPPGTDRGTFDLPPDRIGRFSVHAVAVERDQNEEGEASVDAFLVVPPRPGLLRIAPSAPRYFVGEEARFSLDAGAPPAGVHAFAALLVRDLAVHAGEAPLELGFLERRFDEALLTPGESGSRLLHVALAATVNPAIDPAPRVAPLVDALGVPLDPDAWDFDRGTPRDQVLLDPFPDALELARRGVAEPMRHVAELLASAIDEDRLDEVTVGAGASRRFAPSILDDDGAETLGGVPITIEDLEANDPSFRYETVARRIARDRWVSLAAALSAYADPGDDAPVAVRVASREPFQRWLPRMVELGLVSAEALRDPWGGHFTLVSSARPALPLSARAPNVELVSPGPDGIAGTADDVRDPFARVVPAGTPWAVASGEDELMRQMALLSAYERATAGFLEAYARITAEMSEELIGDAVRAQVSEGVPLEGISLGRIGTIGHGSGTGSGYASDTGYGRLGRQSRAAAPAALRGLARVVRARFPATLAFIPSVRLDAEGRATLSVPIADAVTAYEVEAITWRSDGWSSSASCRIEADREILADAPVPSFARLGDRLELPVRIENHGARPRALLVRVLESPSLGITASEPERVEVPEHDVVRVVFPLALDRAAEGEVRIAVSTPEGDAVDALALPLAVLRSERASRRTLERVTSSRDVLSIPIPPLASVRRAEVSMTSGEWIFGGASEASRWIGAFRGLDGPPLAADDERRRDLRVAASLLVDGSYEAAELRRLVEATTRRLDEAARSADRSRAATEAASVLLAFAPVTLRAELSLDLALARVLTRARRLVVERALESVDPDVMAPAAAALAVSTREPSSDPVLLTLVARLERHLATSGEDVVLLGGQSALRDSAGLAIAWARLGRRTDALSILATLARWSGRERELDFDTRELAQAATILAGSAAPEGIDRGGEGGPVGDDTPRVERMRLGPADHELTLVPDDPTPIDPALLGSGVHALALEAEPETLVWTSASVEYVEPWPSAPRRGPLSVAITDEPRSAGVASEIEVVVTNTSPRVLERATLTLELPAGLQLTQEEIARITSESGSEPAGSIQDGVLRVSLGRLRPGGARRLQIPFSSRIGGRISGLGASAFEEDHPERATIVPPRTLELAFARGGAR